MSKKKFNLFKEVAYFIVNFTKQLLRHCVVSIFISYEEQGHIFMYIVLLFECFWGGGTEISTNYRLKKKVCIELNKKDNQHNNFSRAHLHIRIYHYL